MIIVRLQGGLGNQMFQYANGRALSLKYKTDLKLNAEALDSPQSPLPFMKKWRGFTKRALELSGFNIKGEVALRNDIPLLYRRYGQNIISFAVEDVIHRLLPHKGQEQFGVFRNSRMPKFKEEVLNVGQNVYLDGWWQNPKYFIEYEDEIRNDFTLREPLQGLAKDIYVEMEKSDSLCVHIRKTDYSHKSIYQNLDISYYERGINYIKAKSKIDCIYVFSDDLEWCKKNINFEYPTKFIDSNQICQNEAQKIILMSVAKNFVIANSTFSWWSAWLGSREGKIVVAPKKWFKADSDNKAPAIIPENWVTL